MQIASHLAACLQFLGTSINLCLHASLFWGSLLFVSSDCVNRTFALLRRLRMPSLFAVISFEAEISSCYACLMFLSSYAVAAPTAALQDLPRLMKCASWLAVGKLLDDFKTGITAQTKGVTDQTNIPIDVNGSLSALQEQVRIVVRYLHHRVSSWCLHSLGSSAIIGRFLRTTTVMPHAWKVAFIEAAAAV